MRTFICWVLVILCLFGASVVLGGEEDLVRLLRVQVFNKEFEGSEHYHVSIEADAPQRDGSREVLAIASGKFLEHAKRLKVLFLIVGDRIIGGQVLEGTGLPPCATPEHRPSLSL
jgi:hypothetical protein